MYGQSSMYVRPEMPRPPFPLKQLMVLFQSLVYELLLFFFEVEVR